MIFVPCRGGISHNEAESTSIEECAAGAQVLLNAVLEYRPPLGAAGVNSAHRVFSKISRPISMRRISLVPAPIS